MRQLTDSERAAMEIPLSEYRVKRDGLLLSEKRAFEVGFIAALDHLAVRIADLIEHSDQLGAECDNLRQRISEAYEKFGRGHHPYAGGAVDALDYVSGSEENEARRALGEETVNEPAFEPPPNDEDFMDM